MQNADKVADFMDIINMGDDNLQLLKDPDIITSATVITGGGANVNAVDNNNKNDDWVMVKRPGA